MEAEGSSDYLSIARDLDHAVSRIMASIYEANPSEPDGPVRCNPEQFTQAVMQVARTAQWAKGLHEATLLYRAKAA